MGSLPGFVFPRSRVTNILGTRACGNANFIQERGNLECERIGMLNLRYCEDMIGHAPPHIFTRWNMNARQQWSSLLRSLPLPSPPPVVDPQVAGFGTYQNLPPPPPIVQWFNCAPLYVWVNCRSLGTRERRRAVEREIHVVQERGNAEREGKI